MGAYREVDNTIKKQSPVVLCPVLTTSYIPHRPKCEATPICENAGSIYRFKDMFHPISFSAALISTCGVLCLFQKFNYMILIVYSENALGK